MDELFEILQPALKAEYEGVARETGISLDDYMKLRRHELEANELRFPGYAEFWVGNIRKFKRFGFAKFLVIPFVLLVKIMACR